jgi:hypothetical protein
MRGESLEVLRSRRLHKDEPVAAKRHPWSARHGRPDQTRATGLIRALGRVHFGIFEHPGVNQFDEVFRVGLF